MQKDEEHLAAIAEFHKRDGYHVTVSNNSMTLSLISDDNEFIRKVATVSLDRIGDSAFVVYQASRALKNT